MSTRGESLPPALRLPFDAAAWGFTALPMRLADSVARQQQRNARLAAALLLLIPVMLMGLYLLSPRAMDAMGLVRPVPLILLLFIAVGVVRAWMLSRQGISGAWLTFSILLEFGLLYGLIWLLHWQYLLPLSAVLKAPTLFYAFVLIAIRALWFDPRYVFLSGGVAATGWAIMTWLALSAEGARRTRDFGEYLISDAVLLGAEVDKIVALLLFTGVLATAIASARWQMIAAARSENANRDLSQYFAAGVADRITDDMPGSGQAQMCEGAVLMADIRGFTDMAEALPPEATLAVLASFHRRLGAIVGAHGGAIDKFLGDGALVTFGCVTSSDTAARDAVTCAQALAQEFAAWREKREREGRYPVRVGVGVAAGRLMAGTIGDGERLEFTIIGDAANRAAKIEKHNKLVGSDALTDAATLALARAQGFSAEVVATRHGEIIGGLRQPVEVVVLA